MAGPLIHLIWTRVRRLGARFAALAARVRAGALRSLAPARRRAASRPASPAPASPPPPPRLPNGFAWLVRLVGREAAGCGGQLQLLLTDPEFATLIAATPQMGRVLRPLCRMLGVEPPALPARPSRSAAGPRPARPQRDTAGPDTAGPDAAGPDTGGPARRVGRRGDRLTRGASGCERRLPAALGFARA